VSVSEAVS